MKKSDIKYQNMYMEMLEKLISTIRYNRAYYGDDPVNHNEIWEKIDNIYNKLTDNNKYIFDNYIVN